MASPVKKNCIVSQCEEISLCMTERFGAITALLSSGHTDRAQSHLKQCEDSCRAALQKVVRLGIAQEKTIQYLREENKALKTENSQLNSILNEDFMPKGIQ